MLTVKFRDGEIVQVIDETTGMWTKAHILGFISSWCAKVSWPNFPSHDPSVITIPAELQNLQHQHRWSIRKWTDGVQRLSRSRHENIKHKELDNYLPRKRKCCETNDEVFFYDEETMMIMRGWVNINDPFVEQMEVWIAEENEEAPDKSKPAIFVPYKNFRAGLEEPTEESLETDEPEELAAPPRKRRAVQPVSTAPLIVSALEETLQTCEGKSFQP
jgi:hypothetical protein